VQKPLLIPPFLNDGDKVAIAATARHISDSELNPIRVWLEQNHLELFVPDELFERDNQFAGSDEHRAHVFNNLISDNSVKAIIGARGGYGTVRMVDKVNWQALRAHPKWVVGFSDMSVVLNHLSRVGVPSLHGPMASTIPTSSPESLTHLADCLRGNLSSYNHPAQTLVQGSAKGHLVGGNLSVMYSILGSDSFPEMDGDILFLEDLDEYLYHVDRMFMAFDRAGVFSRISALVIGGMTEMKDNTIEYGFSSDNPFGYHIEEIVSGILKSYNIPVILGAPSGHLAGNYPLFIGREAQLDARNGMLNIVWT
jgi:muramoyltetrapeptide carboxypeptidase